MRCTGGASGGANESYTVHKLGAFAADLAALAGFFAAPWQRPQPALTAPARRWC
jgi:hypothetical protein